MPPGWLAQNGCVLFESMLLVIIVLAYMTYRYLLSVLNVTGTPNGHFPNHLSFNGHNVCHIEHVSYAEVYSDAASAAATNRYLTLQFTAVNGGRPTIWNVPHLWVKLRCSTLRSPLQLPSKPWRLPIYFLQAPSPLYALLTHEFVSIVRENYSREHWLKLFYDACLCHMTLHAIQMLWEVWIMVVALPGRTSDNFKSLHISVFGPLWHFANTRICGVRIRYPLLHTNYCVESHASQLFVWFFMSLYTWTRINLVAVSIRLHEYVLGYFSFLLSLSFHPPDSVDEEDIGYVFPSDLIHRSFNLVQLSGYQGDWQLIVLYMVYPCVHFEPRSGICSNFSFLWEHFFFFWIHI